MFLYICIHACIHAYLCSISITPSFLFSFPLCHVIFFYFVLPALFSILQVDYIIYSHSSKFKRYKRGCKVSFPPCSSATSFFSLKATNVTKFVYLFLKYCLPSFYTIDLILYYYLNLAFSLNLEDYPTSHIYACKAPLLSLNLLSMAFYFVYVPLLI